MDSKDLKKKLRASVKALKLNLSKEDKFEEAQAVFNKLEQLGKFGDAQYVLLYWSLNDELPTHSFIRKWHKSKHIYLPKVVGDDVNLHRFHGLGSLKKGAFGIMEPEGDELHDLSLIDLAVIPGIAFTSTGKRMGRGGGYYDRLLPKLENAFKVGVGYSCQLVNDIPTEAHDVAMDLVIS